MRKHHVVTAVIVALLTVPAAALALGPPDEDAIVAGRVVGRICHRH